MKHSRTYFQRPLVTFALASVALSSGAWAQSDDCATATSITGVGNFAFDTSAATSSSTGCWGSKDVFWSWAAPADGDYLVRVQFPAGTNPFDGSLGVFQTSTCDLSNPGTQLGCASFNLPIQSIPIVGALAGDTYVMQVGNFETLGGPGELSIALRPCDQGTLDDSFEDNDTFNQRSPIALGTHAGLYVSVDDHDFYDVIIPPHQSLDAQVQGNLGAIRLVLYTTDLGIIENQLGPVSYRPQSAAPTPVILRVIRESGSEWGPCTNYDLTLSTLPDDPRISSFCNPPPTNSTGWSTNLWAEEMMIGGTPQMVLQADHGPEGSFTFALVGSAFSDPGIPLGLGDLCLSGSIGRYNIAGTSMNSMGNFDTSRRYRVFGAGLTNGFAIPSTLPTNGSSILSGQTWHFQLWHRDFLMTSNLTNGVSIQF